MIWLAEDDEYFGVTIRIGANIFTGKAWCLNMDGIPQPEKGSGKKWAARRIQTRASQSGKGAADSLMQAIDSSDFEKAVLENELPVVLEFFTVFCPPCRELEPTLEEFAREYVDRVKVVRIRMDTNVDISGTYGVSLAPTLIVFSKGQPLERRLMGPVPKEAIIKLLEDSALL